MAAAKARWVTLFDGGAATVPRSQRARRISSWILSTARPGSLVPDDQVGGPEIVLILSSSSSAARTDGLGWSRSGRRRGRTGRTSCSKRYRSRCQGTVGEGPAVVLVHHRPSAAGQDQPLHAGEPGDGLLLLLRKEASPMRQACRGWTTSWSQSNRRHPGNRSPTGRPAPGDGRLPAPMNRSEQSSPAAAAGRLEGPGQLDASAGTEVPSKSRKIGMVWCFSHSSPRMFMDALRPGSPVVDRTVIGRVETARPESGGAATPGPGRRGGR